MSKNPVSPSFGESSEQNTGSPSKAGTQCHTILPRASTSALMVPLPMIPRSRLDAGAGALAGNAASVERRLPRAWLVLRRALVPEAFAPAVRPRAGAFFFPALGARLLAEDFDREVLRATEFSLCYGNGGSRAIRPRSPVREHMQPCAHRRGAVQRAAGDGGPAIADDDAGAAHRIDAVEGILVGQIVAQHPRSASAE